MISYQGKLSSLTASRPKVQSQVIFLVLPESLWLNWKFRLVSQGSICFKSEWQNWSFSPLIFSSPLIPSLTNAHLEQNGFLRTKVIDTWFKISLREIHEINIYTYKKISVLWMPPSLWWPSHFNIRRMHCKFFLFHNLCNNFFPNFFLISQSV